MAATDVCVPKSSAEVCTASRTVFVESPPIGKEHSKCKLASRICAMQPVSIVHAHGNETHDSVWTVTNAFARESQFITPAFYYSERCLYTLPTNNNAQKVPVSLQIRGAATSAKALSLLPGGFACGPYLRTHTYTLKPSSNDSSIQH